MDVGRLAFDRHWCITKSARARLVTELPLSNGRVTGMDFFETQERYRRREMRGWLMLLLRVLTIGGVLWVGWLWGQAEQTSLQAEADLVIYENNIKISQLSAEVQTLKRELAEARATQTVNQVTNKSGAKLRRLIVKKIANGVAPEQISLALRSIGKAENCREVARDDVAVATPLYAGYESKLSIFDGGLNLSVEGKPSKKTAQNQTWFDPTQEVSARLVFLGGEKRVSGLLPFSAIVAAEDWVIKLVFERAALLGYVTISTKSCSLR